MVANISFYPPPSVRLFAFSFWENRAREQNVRFQWGIYPEKFQLDHIQNDPQSTLFYTGGTGGYGGRLASCFDNRQSYNLS